MENTLTMPRLNALYKEWQKHPPLPIMVASYLGIKPQQTGTPEELAERLKGMPGVRISTQKN